MPPSIRAGSTRVVLLYVEPSLRDAQGRRWPRQVTLYRPHDGACFEHFCQAGRPSTDGHHEQMGLARSDFDAALSPEQLALEVESFLGPDAVLLSWNGAPARLLEESLGVKREAVVLKHVLCSLMQHGAGSLEDTLVQEGLEPLDLGVKGRAAIRLGGAASLLDAVQQRVAECAAWPTKSAPRTASAPSVKPPAG